jgi:hypothetical protein
MRTGIASALAACLSLLQAQESSATGRGLAVGEVRLADGRPWVGAEVVLLARPLGRATEVDADRVVATVDERGRFRAPILRGRPYSAWAWGPATATGRPASAVCEQVFVQQPIVLRHERDLPARDLVLDHLDRWPEAKFQLRVIDELDNLDVHTLEVQDGRVRLPWLVGPQATVELFVVDGTNLHPLQRTMVASSQLGPRLVVPERVRVTCFARSTDETPLVGARIHRHLGQTMHFVGITDAAGTLTLDTGNDEGIGIQTLVEGSDGRMGVFLSIADVRRMGQVELPAGVEPRDLWCRVDPGRMLHARFVTADGTPLAGADIVQSGMATNSPTPASRSYHGWHRTRRTDATGTIALPGRTDHVGANLLLRERDLPALPAPWRPGLCPVVFAPLSVATGTGTPEDPMVVDLKRMCPIELTFTGPGATPVASVDVILCTLGTTLASYWPAGHDRARSDERGRVRILVPAGQPIGIAATHGMSLLIRAFVTTPGDPTAGPATATFALPAPTGIRGRLLGKDGQPMADRMVYASLGTSNHPALWNWLDEPESKLARGSGNTLRVLLPEDESSQRILTSLIGIPVPTDANGCFALPLPPVAVPRLLLFQGERDARSLFDKFEVTWRGEAIDDLEWTVRF